MRADECFRPGCHRRRCYYRIYTEDRRFDEVACREHHHALECHADRLLGAGPLRHHVMSSNRQIRDQVAVLREWVTR